MVIDIEMNFKYVINSGCSFSYGTDLQDVDSRYPLLIAKKLGAELIDYSAPGNMNELIASYAISGILKIIDEGKIDLNKSLTIINWTYPTRFKYFNTNADGYYIFTKQRLFRDKWFDQIIDRMSFTREDLENYFLNHKSETIAAYTTIKEIYYMQLFLQSHNIDKYIFTFPFRGHYNFVKGWMWKDVRDRPFNKKTRIGFQIPPTEEISARIDDSKIFKSFLENVCEDNDFPRGLTDHPLEQTHVEYSKLLYEFVEQLYGEKVN